ncbi:diguanylate cyclase [Roseburia hominis]
MDWFRTKINDTMAGMQEAIRDDDTRKRLMFEWLNILLALVSLVMTVVNFFTREYTLMMSTLFFSVACIVNVVFAKRDDKKGKMLYIFFAGETIVLLAFFLVSGIPNGFSALWVCLVPSFSLLIFGRKSGTLYSTIVFLMLIFLFWVPFGKKLLWYRYTDEFMLRFPFYFVACYLLALFVEIIRAQTQGQLLESEQKFRHLYCHDALTGVYNRYGFNSLVDADYQNPKPEKVAVMIIDIDNFKNVNDRYGHNNGDIVLKGIAEILEKAFCRRTYYCRWGGEEFTVYLHCEHDYQEAAERFRRLVEEAEFRSGNLVMKVTVSVGLCMARTMVDTSIATMVNLADQCLYKAKDKGKNCVVSVEIP